MASKSKLMDKLAFLDLYSHNQSLAPQYALSTKTRVSCFGLIMTLATVMILIAYSIELKSLIENKDNNGILLFISNFGGFAYLLINLMQFISNSVTK